MQGTDFEQLCELIEGSSAQIVWSKRDDELLNNVNIHGPVLKISKLTPENQGFYICSAENQLGNDQIEIFIEVESKCRMSINFRSKVINKFTFFQYVKLQY